MTEKVQDADAEVTPLALAQLEKTALADEHALTLAELLAVLDAL